MKLAGISLAILCGTWLLAGSAMGQIFERSRALPPADVEPLDATTATHLENARRFLAEKQWDEAVDAIRRGMEGDAARYVAVADQPSAPEGFQRLVPIREFCQWRLAALAREAPQALAHYRSLADPLAEQWLAAAVENRDERLLTRIVSEAFATKAGDNALLRLGDLALSHGDFAQARGYFTRIGPQLRDAADQSAELRAEIYPDSDLPAADVAARLVLTSILSGDHDRAAAELDLFRRQYADATGKLAGRDGNLADILTALATQAGSWPPAKHSGDWLSFAGDAPRRGIAAGPIDPAGTPLWSFPLPRLTSDRDMIGAGRLRVADDMKSLRSYHPIVVGDTVLVRCDARQRSYIVALGLRDGLRPWQVDALRVPATLTAAGEDDSPFEVSDAHASVPRHVGVARYTLTASGNKLFARMGSPVTAPPASIIEKLLAKEQAFLMGYDLTTEGKPLEGFPIRPESSEWSFEGTPVCDGANLYVAMRRVEQGRCQLHVACFALTAGGTPIDDVDDDARPAGRMLWRTRVGSAATLGGGDWAELSHCLLTLDGGTLLVNSNLGVIAALNADGGDVQWLHIYPRASFRSGDPDRQDEQFFRDLTPCLPAGDLVICAPADCDRLFALDRTTGRFVWSTEPGVAADAIHLLGTSGDWLIATGNRLYWIELASGQVRVRYPEGGGSGPTEASPQPRGLGRGILAGDKLYWPTRESILVFSVAPRSTSTGFAPAPLDDIPLLPRNVTGGNLVFAHGILLIATGDKLVAFEGGRKGAAVP